jgi:hypothetical protein
MATAPIKQKTARKKPLPRPGRKQAFKTAHAETVKQFDKALAKLAR